MKLQRSSIKRKARIEIIPLIDIIFFLLATFVMVSMSMVKNQGVSVRLPKASTGVTQERATSATITIKENGDLFLNKDKVVPRDLQQRLLDLKAANPDQKVFINGDELAYFGDIVTVLDNIRKVGIEKIAIQTKGAASETALSSSTEGEVLKS
jgi:biopolymer transport protein ExbD